MTSEDRAIVRTSAVARGALFVTSLGYPQCSGSHATLSTIVTLPGYASLCVADKNLTFLFFFLFFFAVSRKYIIEHSLCSPGRCRNCFARGTVVWRRDGFHVGGKRWNTQCVCFTFSLSLSWMGEGGWRHWLALISYIRSICKPWPFGLQAAPSSFVISDELRNGSPRRRLNIVKAFVISGSVRLVVSQQRSGCPHSYTEVGDVSPMW